MYAVATFTFGVLRPIKRQSLKLVRSRLSYWATRGMCSRVEKNAQLLLFVPQVAGLSPRSYMSVPHTETKLQN